MDFTGVWTCDIWCNPQQSCVHDHFENHKASTLKLTEKLDISEATSAAIANGAAGLVSSMASQTVFVPLDVVGVFSAPIFLFSCYISSRTIVLILCFYFPPENV